MWKLGRIWRCDQIVRKKWGLLWIFVNQDIRGTNKQTNNKKNHIMDYKKVRKERGGINIDIEREKEKKQNLSFSTVVRREFTAKHKHTHNNKERKEKKYCYFSCSSCECDIIM